MSRRPDAKTVKISESALNKLKHVKEDNLKENSYSQSIIIMVNELESSKKVGKFTKIEFTETSDAVLKDKTIVLSRDAHVLLNSIKYDLNFKTISDAIEYLCEQWKTLNP
jgi:hypothetical protein